MDIYKEKYEKALERARQVHTTNVDENKKSTEYIFPELKESEEEEIRNEIIQSIQDNMCVIHKDKCIAWLEKQGEQKPTDKVETKFKVGDFIINEYGFIMQIDGIDGNLYVYHILDDNRIMKHDITKTDESCHLWTIQDAKDGDVLAVDYIIFIYKTTLASHVVSYCRLIGKEFDHFEYARTCNEGNSYVHPATKEQRDLLFTKMKEAGYEWDAKKNELKKIEQKPVWSEDDEKLLNLSLENLRELKNWFGETYGKVCNCINWLKSIKERMKVK